MNDNWQMSKKIIERFYGPKSKGILKDPKSLIYVVLLPNPIIIRPN